MEVGVPEVVPCPFGSRHHRSGGEKRKRKNSLPQRVLLYMYDVATKVLTIVGAALLTEVCRLGPFDYAERVEGQRRRHTTVDLVCWLFENFVAVTDRVTQA